MLDGIGHPRTSGTYSKVLGRYVREAGSLTLMDALRKMTLMPARRLESRVPGMRDKGRIRVGADADLTIFDAARIIDRATYREPSLPPWDPVCLVNGVPIVRAGSSCEGSLLGTEFGRRASSSRVCSSCVVVQTADATRA